MTVSKKSRSDELDALKRYELLFRATNDVLYDVNLQSAHVLWNDALYTQYGYKKSDVVNTIEWWATRIHPDDAMSVEGKFSDVFESDVTVIESTYRFKRADHTYANVLDRGYLLRDDQGKPSHIIGSLLDITESTKLSRAKDEFISLVSHQLRTPLTVIKFYSQMILDGLLGDFNSQQRDPIAKISDASTNLIKLVGDILNVSRIELERIRISPIMSEVEPVIKKLVESVEPLAQSKQIDISYNVHKSASSLSIDVSIFEQILDNLLSNSIRYARSDGAKVTIIFKKRRDGYALIVQDNGIGIPVANRKYIFERFYRADNARNVLEEGTGLGLYYVRVLANAFGGDITFTSQENEGTSFFVSIPLSGMKASQSRE